MLKLFTAIVTLIGLAQAANAATLPVIAVSKSNFIEKFQPKWQISNEAILVGWQRGPVAKQLGSPVVTVSGIQSTDRTLCVAIEQVSGGYSAYGRIPNPKRGAVIVLRLPSTLFVTKAGLNNIDLALLVRTSSGANCTGNSPVLASGWGDANELADTSVLLSLAIGSVARLSMQGVERSVSCEGLDRILPDPRRIRQRFNTICRLSLPSPCRAESRYELVVDSGNGREPPLRGMFRRRCAA